MSRLDFHILRLQAQRACLNLAAELIVSVPGPVWELGLGNGRTYDHLREILPERAIYVFDREVAAHPTCVPPAPYMILGDLQETLPKALSHIGELPALVHCDLGTRDAACTLALSKFVGKTLENGLIQPGCIIASDQPLPLLSTKSLALPGAVAKGRYFLYSSVVELCAN